MDVMPKWAEVILVPLISLLLAALLSALVILAIGEDPIAAVTLMVKGALGSTYGWGYTLYYATNFIAQTGAPDQQPDHHTSRHGHQQRNIRRRGFGECDAQGGE